jgi:hypothetical protein
MQTLPIKAAAFYRDPLMGNILRSDTVSTPQIKIQA